MARPRRCNCGYYNAAAFAPVLPSLPMSMSMRSSSSSSTPKPGEPRETTFNIHNARNTTNNSSSSNSSSNGGDDVSGKQGADAVSSTEHRNRTKSKILLTRLVPPSILRNQSTSRRRSPTCDRDANYAAAGAYRGRTGSQRRRDASRGNDNGGYNYNPNYKGNSNGNRGEYDAGDGYSSISPSTSSTPMISLPTLYSVEEAKSRTGDNYNYDNENDNGDEYGDGEGNGNMSAIRRALRGGPLKTFIFHGTEAGLFGGILGRRRSGDPPLRQLNVTYGRVHERSMSKKFLSNPRIHGGLRSWYVNAIKLGVLARKQPRTHTKLSLSAERLVLKPKVDYSQQVRTRKKAIQQGPGIPQVATSEFERSLGESPRLIVIGDIHGCIDEFKALLRLANFQPGDQVILLGDLVAKGPDSIGVVQLAREINARSVRGNHDHEVIRWFEANSRGGADAVVSLEHARIARSLNSTDHAWLMDSPWFIESADMKHLFVHAGFIPGVKLTQQNPRLMMNMRSVLDDGTVTAKNVPHCGWARLWRGPQTVVFGHDAFRGLQQYEFAKGIDTGCVYGGRLTALLLPENRFISVPAKRAYVSSKRFRSREAARKMKVQLFDAGDEIQSHLFEL